MGGAGMSLFRRRLAIACQLFFDYKELDYIESAGNTYIDTGVPADARLKFRIQFSNWEYANGSGIFGSSFWNTSLIYYHGTLRYCLPTKAYSYSCGDNVSLSGTLTCTENGCTGDFEMTEVRDANAGSLNITLFRGGIGIAKARVHSFKIWDSSGTLVRSFIPLMRKSDKEIGMYDLVNNKFYLSIDGVKFKGK